MHCKSVLHTVTGMCADLDHAKAASLPLTLKLALGASAASNLASGASATFRPASGSSAAYKQASGTLNVSKLTKKIDSKAEAQPHKPTNAVEDSRLNSRNGRLPGQKALE